MYLPHFEALGARDTFVDVFVRVSKIGDSFPRFTKEGSWYYLTRSEANLVWHGVGHILIRRGQEIIVDPASGAEESLIHQAIVGPAFGVLLQQRGLFPLHASCVAFNGNAIALVGDSGCGKSTLAAALHSRGHKLVCDDITAIGVAVNPLIVYPGFPRFRLWPKTLTALGGGIRTHKRIHTGTDKSLISISDGFAESALPLLQIYILAEDDSERIEPLSRQEGLLAVMRFCYRLELIRAAIGLPALMEQCARISRCVKISILKRRRSFEALSSVAALVENGVSVKDTS